jgi:hypothetical protein
MDLEHYAMSFLIYDENWNEVIELTKRTKALKENGQLPRLTLLPLGSILV